MLRHKTEKYKKTSTHPLKTRSHFYVLLILVSLTVTIVFWFIFARDLKFVTAGIVDGEECEPIEIEKVPLFIRILITIFVGTFVFITTYCSFKFLLPKIKLIIFKKV